MKSSVLCVVATALVLRSITARAQSNTSVAVKIPFDFMVGRTMFPAGKYTLNSAGEHTFVLAAQNGYEFVVIKTSSISLKSDRFSGIVFANGGHHQRLRELKLGKTRGEILVNTLPVSKPHPRLSISTVSWVSRPAR
jgi:hypothetical protein